MKSLGRAWVKVGRVSGPPCERDACRVAHSGQVEDLPYGWTAPRRHESGD